jgi:diguanylate cyclase (GGDEF)-like protein
MLPNTNLKGAHIAAQRIAAALANANYNSLKHEQDVQPQLSIGIASYRKGESHEDLLRRADSALYSAKSNGRNCIC